MLPIEQRAQRVGVSSRCLGGLWLPPVSDMAFWQLVWQFADRVIASPVQWNGGIICTDYKAEERERDLAQKTFGRAMSGVCGVNNRKSCNA